MSFMGLDRDTKKGSFTDPPSTKTKPPIGGLILAEGETV